MNKMKVKKIYYPILFFTTLALGILIGNQINFYSPKHTTSNSKAKLDRLIQFIEAEYVDPIDSDSIVDLTVTQILAKLDPHSVYIPKDEYTAETENMQGDFQGIGVSFYMFNDTLAVIKPLEKSPSEKAGIKAGERILYANKKQLFGKKLPTDSLFAFLRGKKNSSVTLSVYNKHTKQLRKVAVKRDVIPLKSVETGFLIQPDFGYIKISRFAETTYSEFEKALQKLKKQGCKKLILDLRGNSGGLLEEAIAIADDLLPKNQTIVKVKNKRGDEETVLAGDGGLFEQYPVYVLLDEFSASASEIIAGAIQDNDRGTIIGRRSFGKGLVQKEMPLGDGTAVRLTIARYYTPSGRSIQKPYNEGKEAYFSEFEKRFSSGELFAKDSIKVADSLRFKTKKGRIVYGGGGIIPDIFVPLKGKHGDQMMTKMLENPTVTSYFVFEYLDKNRPKYEKWSVETFKQNLLNTTDLTDSFSAYLKKRGLNFNFSESKKHLNFLLVAEAVKQVYNDDEYYKMLVKEDEMIKKAIQGR